ncbi:MAG: RsbRD N-terminal domain-containing protein [Desulfomonilaceae bacterium]
MLKNLLDKNKNTILKRWSELVFATYSPETAQFLAKQSNEFANPVGAAITRATAGIFEWIMDGAPIERELEVHALIDDIVRIRAVQQFSASDAVNFIFILKKAIRESLSKDIRDQNLVTELYQLDSTIDQLALAAFDIYMKCREKVFEIRATELRNRTSRILERACMKYGAPHEW